MKSKQLRKTRGAEPTNVIALNAKCDPEPDEHPVEVTLTSPLSGVTMRFRIVLVTPEIAKRWLEKNHPENRPIAHKRVESFANDIRNGAWKLVHQSVAFDGQGYLIDGQHRLEAIVHANVAAEMLVIYNDAGSYHDPIDRGGSRSIATITGFNTREVSALAMLRGLEQGFQSRQTQTLADAIEGHEKYRAAIELMASRVRNRTKLQGATLAACIWTLPVAEHHVIEFANKVASGEMIQKGDPVFALRNWLERNKRIGSWEVAMATFNCLRYFIHGLQLKGVFTGPMGYRAVTSRRRAAKVPGTPDVDLVPSGNWTPTRGEELSNGEA